MTTRNPWKTKVAAKKKPNPFLAKRAGSTSSTDLSPGRYARLQSECDKARQDLFDAGWEPQMAYRTTQEPEHHELLLALGKAMEALTKYKIARIHNDLL